MGRNRKAEFLILCTVKGERHDKSHPYLSREENLSLRRELSILAKNCNLRDKRQWLQQKEIKRQAEREQKQKGQSKWEPSLALSRPILLKQGHQKI